MNRSYHRSPAPTRSTRQRLGNLKVTGRNQCFVKAAMNLFMMRLVFDGAFAIPHHQACRMERAKFVQISAKKQMVASGINQAHLRNLHRLIS
jgi:hypothetical protein